MSGNKTEFFDTAKSDSAKSDSALKMFAHLYLPAQLESYSKVLHHKMRI